MKQMSQRATSPPPLGSHEQTIQRTCTCGESTSTARNCEICRRKLLVGREESFLQPKLTVGAPDDPFEREADRMAERVAQRQEAPEVEEEELQTKGLGVQRQETEEEEEEEIQTKRTPGATPKVTPAIEAAIRSVRSGGGRPLPAGVRGRVEPQLGHSFSDVRVHTGGEAARLARGLDAKAFTVGRDVVFGAGQYAPESSAGLRLLAHELTHTIQQGAIDRREDPSGQEIVRRAPVSPADAAPESEEAAGEKAAGDAADAGGDGADSHTCRNTADVYGGVTDFVGTVPSPLTADFGATFNPIESMLGSGGDTRTGLHFSVLNGKPLPGDEADVARRIRGDVAPGSPRGVVLEGSGNQRRAYFDPAKNPPKNSAESWAVLPPPQAWNAVVSANSATNFLITLLDDKKVPVRFKGGEDDCRNRSETVVVKSTGTVAKLAEIVGKHERRHASDWRKIFCGVIGRRDRRIARRTGRDNAKVGRALNNPQKAEKRALRKLFQGILSREDAAAKILERNQELAKQVHLTSRLNIQLSEVTVSAGCKLILLDLDPQPRRGEAGGVLNLEDDSNAST